MEILIKKRVRQQDVSPQSKRLTVRLDVLDRHKSERTRWAVVIVELWCPICTGYIPNESNHDWQLLKDPYVPHVSLHGRRRTIRTGKILVGNCWSETARSNDVVHVVGDFVRSDNRIKAILHQGIMSKDPPGTGGAEQDR